MLGVSSGVRLPLQAAHGKGVRLYLTKRQLPQEKLAGFAPLAAHLEHGNSLA